MRPKGKDRLSKRARSEEAEDEAVLVRRLRGPAKTAVKSEMATPKTRAMAEVDETQGDEYEVERIITHRRKNNSVEYYVSWVGYDSSEDQWVSHANAATAAELLEQYWNEQPLVDQCERYKTNSRAWHDARAVARLAADAEKRQRAQLRRGSPSPEQDEDEDLGPPEGAEEQLLAFNSSLVGLMEALTAYTSESTSTAASSSTSTALSTAQSTLAARRDQAGLALLHLLHALSPSSQKSVALPTPLKLEPPPPPAPALGPTIDERFAAMQAAHAQSLAALRLEFTQREQATDVRLSSLVDAKVTALASLVDAKLAERDQSSRALLDSKVAELSTSLELNPKRSPASVYAGSPRDRELVLGSLPPAPDSFVSSEKFRVWRERLYQSEFPQLQVQIEQRLFPRVVALEAHVGKGDEWLKVLSERMAGLEARTMGVEQRVGVCEAWGRERMAALEKSVDTKLGVLASNVDFKLINLSSRVSNTPTYEKIIDFVNQQIAVAQLVLPPAHAPPPAPTLPTDLAHRLGAVEELQRVAERQWQTVEKRLPDLIDSRVATAVPAEVAKVAAEAKERREAREAKKRARGA